MTSCGVVNTRKLEVLVKNADAISKRHRRLPDVYEAQYFLVAAPSTMLAFCRTPYRHRSYLLRRRISLEIVTSLTHDENHLDSATDAVAVITSRPDTIHSNRKRRGASLSNHLGVCLVPGANGAYERLRMAAGH